MSYLTIIDFLNEKNKENFFKLKFQAFTFQTPTFTFQALVHLSTAFCHCEYETLEEVTYPSPANPHDIIRVCQWMDDTTLEIITPRLLGPHPNCYTYSKRLAESLVSEYGAIIPCAIARPSIGNICKSDDS
ncbi:hypothetical protein J6590_090139 [Homalodisca vitripennis]|nr:hypothetical protein J6590_090139 [Homalodisca vitripennis]